MALPSVVPVKYEVITAALDGLLQVQKPQFTLNTTKQLTVRLRKNTSDGKPAYRVLGFLGDKEFIGSGCHVGKSVKEFIGSGCYVGKSGKILVRMTLGNGHAPKAVNEIHFVELELSQALEVMTGFSTYFHEVMESKTDEEFMRAVRAYGVNVEADAFALAGLEKVATVTRTENQLWGSW